MTDTTTIIRLCRERAAQYGTVRRSSLTAIALDRAANALEAALAHRPSVQAGASPVGQETADRDKLREVVGELAAYTSHHIGCALYQQSWASGAPRCSCGLDTVKATLTAAIAPHVKIDQKDPTS